MRPTAIALAVLLGACTSAALAQAQAPVPPKPTPDQLHNMMDSSMRSALTMMEKMAEAQVEAQLKVAARPETAEHIATFKKNLFEALRRKGFSPEQAMQITLVTPWSAATGAK